MTDTPIATGGEDEDAIEETALDKLLPCPNCQGTELTLSPGASIIYCWGCECRWPASLWNRRASPAVELPQEGEKDISALSPRDEPSDEQSAAFLIWPSSDEGCMRVVCGRAGVELALATEFVFNYASIADLSAEHRDELTALMGQFDDPDEWSRAGEMFIGFEDGGLSVLRLSAAIARRLAREPETRGEADSNLSPPPTPVQTEEMERLLEPFLALADAYGEDAPDDQVVRSAGTFGDDYAFVTVKDLRALSALLSTHGEWGAVIEACIEAARSVILADGAATYPEELAGHVEDRIRFLSNTSGGG